MNKLKFRKEEILECLTKNRKLHKEVTIEAQRGYREQLKDLLESKLKDLSLGKEVQPRLDITVPRHYLDDYDRAIEMLTMSVDEEIELTEQEFQCYVRNKWNWMGDFLLSNSRYSPTATKLSSEL